MKSLRRKALLMMAVMMATLPSMASGYDVFGHKKVTRIGYTMESIEQSNGAKWKPNMAFNFDCYRNFYVHRKPIAGQVKVAIDFGSSIHIADCRSNRDYLNGYNGPQGYLGPEVAEGNAEEGFALPNLGSWKLDAGLKIGPSVTYNPIGRLRLNAYFHYTPTFSMLMDGCTGYMGYASMLDYGLEVSYGFIGVGVEMRQGAGTYHDMMAIMDKAMENGIRPQFLTRDLTFNVIFRF